MDQTDAGRRPRHLARAALLGTLLVLAGAACGGEGTTSTTPPPTTGPGTGAGADQPRRYEVTTTVLESPEHGPQACLAGVLTSMPPQCGGPELVGWDWNGIEHEASNGTRWGAYQLVVTWDGEDLTPLEPVAPAPPIDQQPTTTTTPPPEPPLPGEESEVLADDDVQRSLDDRYERGAVVVTSALQPLP